ncbi:hypothetical protein RN001_003221 [Aquatica leii]|uniref:Uncharacterized protein n=1 Tax=Aquatica leii TaxID=1421715 RepID=A0AAN7SSZ6_9COLE|nr:hypothetical protein RN001_003221 [Aquatica leii]
MPEKETLVKNIVKHYIDRNIPMTLDTCQDIAIQICNKFENESMEYYFVKKPKASGRLYNRYRSESSSFKKSGLFTGFIREKRKNRTTTKECGTEDTSDTIDATNQIEEKEWLKTRSSPWDAVELKWKQSFNLRRNDVKSIVSMNKLFEEWPLFLHSNGSRLIDIDFELIFPGKSNVFFEKWNSVESKLVEACKKYNKFPAASDILESLPNNPVLHDYEKLVLRNTMQNVYMIPIHNSAHNLKALVTILNFVFAMNSDYN